MINAELINSLKDAEKYIDYVAPVCCGSREAIKAIRAAADALEAAEKRIAELEAQMPKDGEWMTNIKWDYQQPTQSAATNVGTNFLCRSTGKPCPNATEYGYCKQTVCNNSGEWMKDHADAD